jgi:hypothetical protein
VTIIQDTSVSVINGSTCNAITTAWCRKTPPKVVMELTPFAAAVDQQRPNGLSAAPPHPAGAALLACKCDFDQKLRHAK